MTTYYCPNPECAGTKLADHFNDNVWSCRKCDWLWDLNREIPYEVMPLTRDPTKPPSTAGWRRGVDGKHYCDWQDGDYVYMTDGVTTKRSKIGSSEWEDVHQRNAEANERAKQLYDSYEHTLDVLAAQSCNDGFSIGPYKGEAKVWHVGRGKYTNAAPPSDNNDGSLLHPFATLGKALDMPRLPILAGQEVTIEQRNQSRIEALQAKNERLKEQAKKYLAECVDCDRNVGKLQHDNRQLKARIKELEERDAFLTVANKRLEEGYPDPPCPRCQPCVECKILGLPDSLAKDNALTLVKRCKEDNLPLPDTMWHNDAEVVLAWNYEGKQDSVSLVGDDKDRGRIGDILGAVYNRERYVRPDGPFEHERRREKHLREPAGFKSKPWR